MLNLSSDAVTMVVPWRKQSCQLVIWLCVTLCCVALVRDFMYSGRDLYAPLESVPSGLRRKMFAASASYPKENVTKAVSSVRKDSRPNFKFFPEASSARQKQSVDGTRDIMGRQSNLNSQSATSAPRGQNKLRLFMHGNENKDHDTFATPNREAHTLFSETRKKESNATDTIDLEVERLTMLLETKLDRASSAGATAEIEETCSSEKEIGNSCEESGCLQLQLPKPLRTRVEQIVRPAHLRMSASAQSAVREMAGQIPRGSDVIVVSGASSNHYLEAQAMLYNLHHNLFPHLSNFTFVYYNLGLKPVQREYIASICRCVLLDFPFHLFPEFVSFLKCYTWKPFIVNAAIQRANLVFWVDASIRFRPDPAPALSLLERARHRGVQMGWSKTTIPQTTLQSMFHFFGDEACAYFPYHQGLSGVVVYHNEWLVRRALLEPWAACAVSGRCMCPQSGVDLFQARISCHEQKGRHYYGVCHRFDQSALSILVSKLYQENVGHVILEDITDYLDIMRGVGHPYSSAPKALIH